MGDDELKKSVDIVNLVRNMKDGETRVVRGTWGIEETIERHGNRILVKTSGIIFNREKEEYVVEGNVIKAFLGSSGLFGRFGQTAKRTITDDGKVAKSYEGDLCGLERFFTEQQETIVDNGNGVTKVVKGQDLFFDFLNDVCEVHIRTKEGKNVYKGPLAFFPSQRIVEDENSQRIYSGISGTFGIPGKTIEIHRPKQKEQSKEEIPKKANFASRNSRSTGTEIPFGFDFGFQGNKYSKSSSTHCVNPENYGARVRPDGVIEAPSAPIKDPPGSRWQHPESRANNVGHDFGKNVKRTPTSGDTEYIPPTK